MSTATHKSSIPNSSTISTKVPKVQVLGFKDVRKAATTLLDSFKDDSVARLLVCHIKDPKEREYAELKLYEAYLRQHIMTGLCLGIGEGEEDFETVAIWSTPDSERGGFDSFGIMMKAGYGEVWSFHNDIGRNKIFFGMLPLLHNACSEIMETDFRFTGKGIYTLVYLGSIARARGKGNARKMFNYIFETHIDASPNNIAYLESSSPTNIPIYEKFGFKVYKDITLGDASSSTAVEGEDYAHLNVMIRDSYGKDWTKITKKSKI